MLQTVTCPTLHRATLPGETPPDINHTGRRKTSKLGTDSYQIYVLNYCTISFKLMYLYCTINQLVYFTERNMEWRYISKITQHTNTGQVPACSQGPVVILILRRLWTVGDNTARNDKFHCPIIDGTNLVHVQLRPRIVKTATVTRTDCELKGSWGIILMLKSIQKQLQRRHRQQCVKFTQGLMFFGRSFYCF